VLVLVLLTPRHSTSLVYQMKKCCAVSLLCALLGCGLLCVQADPSLDAIGQANTNLPLLEADIKADSSDVKEPGKTTGLQHRTCPNPAASDPLACCELSSDPRVCRYYAHQQNTTELSWMAAHFKRTREGSCANHTCWHALSCENSGAPSTPCDFSSTSYSTSYCLPAAGFQNAKCKSLMLINCPCDGATDIDAYLDSVMADYATRYKTEWLNRHSDAATRSAIAASNEAFLVNRSAVDLSIIAKETLGTCAQRNCNNRLAASTSAASGGSSEDLDVDLEEASLVDVLFGGGSTC